MSSLIGRSLHISYDSGMVIEATYDRDSVTWNQTAGPNAGLAGANPASYERIADDIWFASWIGEDTTTVSQVVDFTTMRVYAFTTYPGEEGRESISTSGKVYDA